MCVWRALLTLPAPSAQCLKHCGATAQEVEGLEVVVEVSSYPGHTVEVARTTDLTGVDVLCTIGGDGATSSACQPPGRACLLTLLGTAGTFYEALNGMMSRTDDTRVPICVIPAGSGNSFSYDLNVLTHMDAVEALLRVRGTLGDAALDADAAAAGPCAPRGHAGGVDCRIQPCGPLDGR